jgi:TRAP-type mannitol/chloroaromatic compound transport system permease small subunit
MDIETKLHTLPVILRILLRPVVWIGQLGSWFVLPLIATVIISIILSMLRIGIVFQWETSIPLFGNQLTLIGLGELQWHFFGIMIFFTGAWVMLKDKHVKVDLIYGRCSKKTQLWINILGNVVLLLPFCSVLLWSSKTFVSRAYAVGEHSLYDGLIDRFLIKSVLPIGFFLLIVVGVIRTYLDIVALTQEIKLARTQKESD